MCQKSLNFTYAFKCCQQKCKWLHFSWATLYDWETVVCVGAWIISSLPQSAVCMSHSVPSQTTSHHRPARLRRGQCVIWFAVVRCLSVRLSVTLVYCIHMAEDILKHICQPGSPVILVFWLQSQTPNSKGNPFSEGAKYMGVGNFCCCDFWLKSSFISETVRGKPMVTMKCYKEVIGGRSIHVDSDDLEWPLTLVWRSLYSYELKISKTVCLRDKVTIEH